MMERTKCESCLEMTVFCAVLVVLVLIPQTEATVVRVRRQGCQDGTYGHNGRVCCKCPAGSKVEEHCTDRSQTTCVQCITGKEYQSDATLHKTCEPCTSCEHPNANLEVNERCTPVVDATCKCKDNHYCTNSAKPCKICELCEVCGPEGIKVPCSATNNTICNDKPQDNTPAITAGILVSLAVLGCIGCAIYIWKKRKSGSKNLNVNVETPAENVPLHELERLGPHIPDIADIIGWKTTRNLSVKSGISEVQIENCEQDYQKDASERTQALLRIWEQKEGKDASEKLIEYLIKTGNKKKAEEVQKILCRPDGSS